MKEKNAVMIVEDNDINRKLLRSILEGEYSIYEAVNGVQALEVLENKAKDIVAIVLDLVMPVMDGYEFLDKMKEFPEYRHIPIIVETGENDTETEKRCLSLGVWEFAVKPYQADVLRMRIEHAVERTRLLQNERDAATGLYKKNYYYRAMKQMIRQDEKKTYSVIWFDIDRFKLFNTFYGSAKGDELLHYIADILRGIASDKRCVYGNISVDKFCLCMEGDCNDADAIAVHIKREIGKYESNFYLKPSIGIYQVEDNGMKVNEMCDNAEVAAVTCKYNVMKFIAFYSNEMGEQILKEQKFTNEMYKALEEEQFKVYLQPKYDVRTNRPYGAEALVRWVHPERGMISPGEFIPIFERNGFVGQLDLYMWDNTCKLLRKWMDEGKPMMPISVNVSRVNLYNPHIAEVIIQLVAMYNVPTEYFHIEITESAFMENQYMMEETIRQLRKEGFKIYMDDFGSGYSSLNVLKDLDVDVLKIDMKFMPTADSDGKGEKILSSIVRMAKWIELPIVAEGVETFEQVEFLRGVGCEYIQGYFFAKPMPVEEYEKLIMENKAKDEVFNQDLDKLGKTLIDDLIKTNSSLSGMLERIQFPVCTFLCEDKRISVLRNNKAFREIFTHFDEEEFYGDEHKEYTIIKDYMQDAIVTGKKTQCEYADIQENNKVRYYNITFQSMAKIGKEHVVLAVFDDITQEKQLEKELAKYRQVEQIKKSDKPRMLIVDDSEISREVLYETFMEDYRIYEAENGKEALKLLQEKARKMDIVLLDLQMPVMDGREFLNYKNADDTIANIPVVVISAEDSEETQLNMLELGISDYVTKPFIMDVTKQRVKNVIEYNSRFRRLMKEYSAKDN